MKEFGCSSGSGLELPTEEEVEVAHSLLLLGLPNTWPKVSRTTFTFLWGSKKKRSVILDSQPESLTQPPDKSPSTPLSFYLPTGGGGDHNNRKPPLAPSKIFKRKATDDLMEVHNRLQQEKETLMKQLKSMQTLHQDLTFKNLEQIAKGQKINYPRNMEDDYHIWNNCMKTIDQQRCHQQIAMFAPATPQDPNNEKQMAVPGSSNSDGGDSFWMFNQMDPRVKSHGEMYDFMGCSQPLDQTKHLVMDGELRVKAAAAAARKRRKLRMKQNNNNTLLCHETIKFKSL